MDFNMNAKLDGLYYRTSATPSLCGPYKTVTTYNGCNAAKAQATQAYSRNDFERSAAENAKMISAAEQSRYKEILQYPKSVDEIVNSKNEGEKAKLRQFIKKFPNLETVLKPLYPKFFENIEGYKYNANHDYNYENLLTNPKNFKVIYKTPNARRAFITGLTDKKKNKLIPILTRAFGNNYIEGYYDETFSSCSSCRH